MATLHGKMLENVLSLATLPGFAAERSAVLRDSADDKQCRKLYARHQLGLFDTGQSFCGMQEFVNLKFSTDLYIILVSSGVRI